MAFRVANLPRTGFTFVVSQVVYPALAQLQNDRSRFRTLFLRSLHWVAVLSVPSSVGMAILAPDLIHVVLGPRWDGAATATRVLAGFGLLASLSATTGDVFKAAGRSGLIFRIGLVHSATLWLGLALLAARGLPWVALAVTLATAASSTVAFACALRVLELGRGSVVRALAAPAGATAVMAAALLAIRPLASSPGVLTLGVEILAGMLAYAATMALLAPEDVRELAGILGVRQGQGGRLRTALRSRAG
jgi:PST family polysaccharide transporter